MCLFMALLSLIHQFILLTRGLKLVVNQKPYMFSLVCLLITLSPLSQILSQEMLHIKNYIVILKE